MDFSHSQFLLWQFGIAVIVLADVNSANAQQPDLPQLMLDNLDLNTEDVGLHKDADVSAVVLSLQRE